MSNKNLLVVDDSATTRMLIRLTLKQEGMYNIMEVANGQEAVEKLGAENVDCVLTDINMPEMNGLDLIAHIRTKHSEPKVPIIIITTQGEADWTLNPGFRDHDSVSRVNDGPNRGLLSR